MGLSSQLEVLDLRHFSAAQLQPLLMEEADRWQRRLFWDYSGSTAVLLKYLDSRVLPGFVALRRGKVADQLHDEVGGLLSLATLNLSSALENGLGDEKTGSKLEKTQEVLQTVGVTVRELSHRLTPLVIEKYGFGKAVEDMVASINLSGKLHVGLVIVGFDRAGRYSEGLLHDLYRMLQELLQNIVKHAQAGNALVQLVEHADGLSVMVEDDGVGIGELQLEFINHL